MSRSIEQFNKVLNAAEKVNLTAEELSAILFVAYKAVYEIIKIFYYKNNRG